MTVLERVKSICGARIDLNDEQPATIEKMIYLAYWIGREEATRRVSDDYVYMIKQMRERAEKCRYKHMAHNVIGKANYLYESDYDECMTLTFGSDKADI